MLKIKINGESRTIETQWAEVSFRKYLALIKAKGDYPSILGVLLGMDPEEFKNCRIQGLEIVIRHMSFTKEPPKIDENPVKIGTFLLPKAIELEQVGQLEDVRAELQRVSPKEGEELTVDQLYEATKSLAFYAAVYCQGATEQYDTDKAKALAETFLDYPCLEVMGVGNFIQAKFVSLQSNLRMNFLRRNIPMKRNKQGFRRLIERLGFMLPWMRSHDIATLQTRKS